MQKKGPNTVSRAEGTVINRRGGARSRGQKSPKKSGWGVDSTVRIGKRGENKAYPIQIKIIVLRDNVQKK